MNSKSVTITAPTRIHFGLFSIDESEPYQFGGMGVMVDKPCVKISGANYHHLKINGQHIEQISATVSKWYSAFSQLIPQVQRVEELPIEIEMLECPHRHSGFGSGTQLSLAVATLLFNVLKMPMPGAAELAISMDRGRRSAIGSHGFFRGGLLVDRGITASDPIAPLELRIDFPEQWRIVCFLKRQSSGLHGKLENFAFEQLMKRNQSNRDQMIELCSEKIIPAVVAAAYQELGPPLFEFNRISGEYYSDYQFGCYHDETCETIVNEIRAAGVDAVGQSSWGPCIYAITESSEHADSLVDELQSKSPVLFDPEQMSITITAANNEGANVDCDRVATPSSPYCS